MEHKPYVNHVIRRHELSGARIRTPLQRQGSDAAVPEDVPEDYGTDREDADLAGCEGQDAGREADGED